MTERRNANLFEVLIGQIRQDDKTNVVPGKARRVLSETELLKPVRNLLHRDPRLAFRSCVAALGLFIARVLTAPNKPAGFPAWPQAWREVLR
jgi:hypothetical protein